MATVIGHADLQDTKICRTIISLSRSRKKPLVIIVAK